MDEPQHPPGPDFEKSRNGREAWRKQQFVALTGDERQQFQDLKERQGQEREKRMTELRRGERQRLIDRTLQHLANEPSPQHDPRGAPRNISEHDLRHARHSVADYVDGKKTPEITKYRGVLQPAYVWAHREEQNYQNGVMAPLRQETQREADRFLEKCERGRKFRENAREVTQQRPSAQFDDAAKDKDREQHQARWERAVMKAQRQEAQREKDYDQDLTDTFNRRR